MKNKKILIIIIPILSVIFILFTMFIIDYSRYLSNKKPIFVISTKGKVVDGTTYTSYNSLLYKVIDYKSLYGKNYMEFTNIFKKVNVIELTKKEYNFIKEYFNEETSKDDSKCFNVVKIYDIENANKRYLKEISVWVRSQCYYVEQRKIYESTGYSIPYKVLLNNKDDLKIEETLYPRDGTLYIKDMKKLFKTGVRLSMDNKDYDDINNDIKQQVEEYFYPLKLDKE